MIYKNAQENKNGSIDCLILLGAEWVPTTQDSAIEYELSEELGPDDWAEIKPCPQSEKDAHAAIEARTTFKAERTAAVQALTVTTEAGNVFDADETSQGRMARAIVALPEGDTVKWVLNNNAAIDATSAELKEALQLAGAAQAALWI